MDFKSFSEIFFCLYFFILFTGTLTSNKFFPVLLQNGRKIQTMHLKTKNPLLCLVQILHNTKISKKFFFTLYTIPFFTLLLFPNKTSPSLFLIHPLRRLCESLVYSRNSKSFMTVIQLIHGLSYYFILTFLLNNIKLNLKIFILLNILQGIAHFRVYYLHKREYSHYYTEVFIHLFFFLSDPIFSKFLNFAYVMSYVYCSRKMRNAGIC